VKKAGWLKHYESTVHALDNFTRLVGTVTKNTKALDFWCILNFAWCVTSVAGLNKVLDEKQVRYLRKLGDYVRILKHMPVFLKQAPFICRASLLEKSSKQNSKTYTTSICELGRRDAKVSSPGSHVGLACVYV
jgi:hypothetical protein